MFDNNVRTEAIPERVLELCKIVSSKAISEDEVREFVEPAALSIGSSPYYPIVRDAAIELGLIEKTDQSLQFIGDKSSIKSLETFRYYCNSVVWKDETTFFYKIGQLFLQADDNWFGENITSSVVLSKMRERISNSVNEPMLLGERFWLSFLGFGYVHESQKIVFLPNMYIAMKDFINMCEFEKNREYSVREFISAICEYSKVAFESVYETKQLNLAVSNALRQLDKNKEIVLKRNSDSKEIWNLYELESLTTTEITHILFKGLKK